MDKYDAELLLGYGYSYSTAEPGMPLKKIIEAGKERCVMHFDELDKIMVREMEQSNEITNFFNTFD